MIIVVLKAYFELRKPCQVEIGYAGNAKMNGVYFLIQSISIQYFQGMSMGSKHYRGVFGILIQ